MYVPMSCMPDMSPTSFTADGGRIIKKVRIFTDEKLTFLKEAWHLKGTMFLKEKRICYKMKFKINFAFTFTMSIV